MKPIPAAYWQQNYHSSELPTFLQQWWVQRWLELTDGKTPHVYTPRLVSIPQLIDELTTWDYHKKYWRTLQFLLSEITMYSFPKRILELYIGSEWSKLEQHSNKILNILNKHLDHMGHKIDKGNPLSETDWRNLCDVATTILKKLNTPNKGTNEYVKFLGKHIASILSLDNIRHDTPFTDDYLYYLETTVAQYLPGGTFMEALPTEPSKRLIQVLVWLTHILDTLTQELIIELVTKHDHPLSYLKEYSLTTFMRPHMDSFLVRTEQFLTSLIGHNRKFDIYLRMQVKRDILHIGTVDNIRFAERLPDMKDIINSLQNHGKLSADEEERARHFFYDGENNPQHVFVIITDVNAQTHNKATVMALATLNKMIQRAKFEFEFEGFSLDNKIYLHEKTTAQLYKYTRRQAYQAQRSLHNRIDKLKDLISTLSKIESKIEPESKTDDDQLATKNFKNFVEKILSFALQWHHSAIEAMTAEAKFLNHWFSLEQIFAHPSLNPPKFDPPKSVEEHVKNKTSSDKLVFTMAYVLHKCHCEQTTKALWQDMCDSGIWGVTPIRAILAGEIGFNDTLREILSLIHSVDGIYTISETVYYTVVNYRVPLPTITIQTKEGDKKQQSITVRPEMVIYIDEQDQVDIDQPIASLWLGNPRKTDVLHTLFADKEPHIMTLWQFLLDLCYQSDVGAAYIEVLQLDSLEQQLGQYESHLRMLQTEVIPDEVTSRDITPRQNAIRMVQEVTQSMRNIIIGIYLLQTKPYALHTSYVHINDLIKLCGDVHHIVESSSEGASTSGFLDMLKNMSDSKEFAQRFQQAYNSTGNTVSTERLEHFYGRRHVIELGMPIYNMLGQTAQLITKNFSGMGHGHPSDAVVAALYRNRTPNLDSLEHIVVNRSEEVVQLCREQPVVAQRIRSYSYCPRSHTSAFYYYLWELDRMKQYRNLLVHEATLPPGLEILAQRLYQYARVYLRYVINRLKQVPKAPEELLDEVPIEWLVGFDRASVDVRKKQDEEKIEGFTSIPDRYRRNSLMT